MNLICNDRTVENELVISKEKFCNIIHRLQAAHDLIDDVNELLMRYRSSLHHEFADETEIDFSSAESVYEYIRRRNRKLTNRQALNKFTNEQIAPYYVYESFNPIGKNQVEYDEAVAAVTKWLGEKDYDDDK